MKTSAGLFLTDILPRRRGLFNKIIKNKIFRNDIPAARVFENLKKSGVDGIELFLPYFQHATYDDIYEVKNKLIKYNMPVFSIHQALRFFTKTKLDEITKLFSFADILKAHVIVLHMSTAGKQVFNKEYITTIHSLQQKYGIKIGFENREKFFMSMLNKYGWQEDSFSQLMKKDNFNITLDTTHLAQAGGNIIRFFQENKDRIVNIHLSDYQPHILNCIRPFRYRHMPLGKGTLPIEQFLETLRQEKYQGLVTMEMHTDLDGMCESARVISQRHVIEN